MGRGRGRGAWALRLAIAVVGSIGLVACASGAKGGQAPLVDLGPGEASPIVALPAATGERRDEGPIHWLSDVDAARARSRRDERPLLVLAVAEWSVPSAELERETLAAPRVVQAARRAVALRLDLTDSDATAHLAEAFRVVAVPTLIVLSPSGEELYRRGASDVDEAELIRALTGE